MPAQPHIKAKKDSQGRWIIDGVRILGKRKRFYHHSRADAEIHLARIKAQVTREGEAGWKLSPEQRVDAAKALGLIESFGATLVDAATHYAAHLAAKSRSIRFSELQAKILAAKKGDNRSKHHVSDLKTRFKQFSKKFGETIVAEIGVTEIDEWLRELGSSQQSRENYRKVLFSAFRYAVKHGYATKNPVAEVERIKVQRGVPAILTATQLRSLLAKAPADVVPYITIGAFAGLRTAEIDSLDWKAIDLDQRLIQVGSDQKTGHRWVDIQPNLVAWLLPYKKTEGRVAPVTAIRLRKEAADDAGIKWAGNILRHSFGSAHAVKFKSLPLTSGQMGNTPSVLLKHYRRLITPAAADAWFDILPSSADNVIQLSQTAS